VSSRTNGEPKLAKVPSLGAAAFDADQTSEVEFGIGGRKLNGTISGTFYLANIAMPHRVDNKGNTTRVALLVDVLIEGHENELKQSALGRSILEALQKILDANGEPIYKQMGRALHEYHCKSFPKIPGQYSKKLQLETEWHGGGWKKLLWRPTPPFDVSMFNTVNDSRCGLFGPLKHFPDIVKNFGVKARRKQKRTNGPARRRRRSLDASA
jgi:hypothetical protein